MTDERQCCRIDAIVTMDSKGQVVLPKDFRAKARLEPNDKLAVIGCERNDETCCFIMVKTERLGNTINQVLGPTLKEVFK